MKLRSGEGRGPRLRRRVVAVGGRAFEGRLACQRGDSSDRAPRLVHHDPQVLVGGDDPFVGAADQLEQEVGAPPQFPGSDFDFVL